jgi:uncharacterized membrane protein (GlpM family)
VVTHDIVVVAIKAVLGGTIVTLFAVIGHVLRPKWFAGLFGAAPSVAIASLAVTVIDKGHHDASLAGLGMLFGAAAFVAYSACVRPLLARTHAVVATALCSAVWVLVAVGGYLLVEG